MAGRIDDDLMPGRAREYPCNRDAQTFPKTYRNRDCDKACKKFPFTKSMAACGIETDGSVAMGVVGMYGCCPRQADKNSGMVKSGRDQEGKG